MKMTSEADALVRDIETMQRFIENETPTISDRMVASQAFYRIMLVMMDPSALGQIYAHTPHGDSGSIYPT